MDPLETKIKVLHIDTGKDWRGGQRQVLTLHKELLHRNINSYLLCNKEGLLYQVALNSGIENIFALDLSRSLFGFLNSQINSNIKILEPNIVHCHESKSVSLVKKDKKYSIFHTRRVSYPIKNLSIFFKYSKVDTHIAVNEKIKKYMSNYFKRVIFIPSCIELFRFKQEAFQEVFKKEHINILYVGAFTEQKGLEILINALPGVVKKYPNIRLHLVGEGPLFQKIKELAINNNLIENVIFYGRRNDIEEFYLSSDYVVFPSINGEGSSGVIKESLAAGKTIIASNLEDNQGLIEDKVTGFFFENGSHESLSTILLKLLDQKVKLNSEILINSVLKYNCKETVSLHIESYKKVITC